MIFWIGGFWFFGYLVFEQYLNEIMTILAILSLVTSVLIYHLSGRFVGIWVDNDSFLIGRYWSRRIVPIKSSRFRFRGFTWHFGGTPSSSTRVLTIDDGIREEELEFTLSKRKVVIEMSRNLNKAIDHYIGDCNVSFAHHFERSFSTTSFDEDQGAAR